MRIVTLAVRKIKNPIGVFKNNDQHEYSYEVETTRYYRKRNVLDLTKKMFNDLNGTVDVDINGVKFKVPLKKLPKDGLFTIKMSEFGSNMLNDKTVPPKAEETLVKPIPDTYRRVTK
jgi:hypothetical protein